MDKDDLLILKLLRLGCVFATVLEGHKWLYQERGQQSRNNVLAAKAFEAYVTGKPTNADEA